MNTPLTAPRTPPINYVALLEVLLLSGTGALLTVKWMRGALDFYIHPRYTLLVLLAALVLFLMGGARLRDLFKPPPHPPITWLHVFLALPLLLGVLVPAQPLGADTLAGRGLSLATGPLSAEQVTGDPASWDLLQWSTAITLRNDELEGESVDVVGFVFQDDSLEGNTFYVARYVVTCCAADAAAAGLPVIWEGGDSLPNDTWIRVQGTLAETTSDGTAIPAIAATVVEPVDEPEYPYLFP